MAVYTDLDDCELHDVLMAFDLGPANAFKGIAEGVSNSNFFLETPKGRFILTIFEKRTDTSELPFFMGVMEHLAVRDFPAPRPLRTRDGGFLHEVKKKPAAIVSFLSGVSPHRPTVAQCRAIGARLAQLHSALSDFAPKRINSMGPGAWRSLIGPRLMMADYLRPGLAQVIEADLDDLEQGWDALPEGVIHADLFPDNALFVGEDVHGVIDFYFACTDALAYDLAVCVNAWCFETRGEFNITKGRALIGGYQNVRALSVTELAALPRLARAAALRFFATRIADWADSPPGALVRPKDPLEYADKLDFHRKARSAAEYGA